MHNPAVSSLNREILSLSVPAVIATITTPLLGLMDTAFTGHMGGAVYLAAIAIGGSIFNLMYWSFGFLRMGTTGLTAQSAGNGDRRNLSAALYRASMLGLIIGLIIVILQTPILAMCRIILSPDTETWNFAVEYYRILVWGAPAVMLTTVFTGWFIGMRSTKSAMWMSIIINLVNLIVSATLVLCLGLKIKGVAAGTLVAQWCGVATGMFLIYKFKVLRHVSLAEFIDLKGIIIFFRINFDIFLRTLCLIAVTLWFTRAGAIYGTVTLAVNALLMQFFILFSYFMDGLAHAAEAMIGQAVGAHDTKRLSSVVRAVLRWGGLIAILFSTLYFIFGDSVILFLSDDIGVNEAAMEYMPWAIAIPIVSAAAFIWDGICIGATATRKMLLSMAIATAIYFSVYLLSHDSFGNHGLWFAFTAYLATRSLVLWAMRPDRINIP